mgnify:FL=1
MKNKKSKYAAKKHKKNLKRKSKNQKKKEEAKDAQRQVNALNQLINNLPKSCHYCDAQFDINDPEMLDTWLAKFEGGAAIYKCPDC